MKKQMALLLVLLLTLLVSACGEAPTASPPSAQPASSPYLQLSFRKTDTNEKDQSFSMEETGGNFTQGMHYGRVSDVTITWNGEALPLEEALQQEKVTREELLALARRDARAGNCEESRESEHGVARYTFRYPEITVLLMDDLFETMEGELLPLSLLAIFQNPEPVAGSTYYDYPFTSFVDAETGFCLDREDWGLEFEVLEVTPTGITLQCSQSGGVQIGDLEINWYHLFDGESYVDTATGEADAPHIPIPMGQESQLTIDWSQAHGALPGGTYALSLYVDDLFDPKQVHPLMEDFHDRQIYQVIFTLP